MPLISPQLLAVIGALATNRDRWLTVSEIRAAAGKIAYRTVNAHLATLLDHGAVERLELFGGYKYRWKRNARHTGFLREVASAAKALEGGAP
jgi:DNA-binding transcriptional ArsR family regulator